MLLNFNFAGLSSSLLSQHSTFPIEKLRELVETQKHGSCSSRLVKFHIIFALSSDPYAQVFPSLSIPSHIYRLRLPPKPVDSYLAPPLDGGEADDPPPPPKDEREEPAPLLLFPNQFDGPACPALGPRLLLRLPMAYPAAAPAAAPLNNPGRQDEELGVEREFCFEYGGD
jgi:hypothetical protein